MPNVMAALPNIGSALRSMPQSLANAHYLTAGQQRCQDAKPRRPASADRTARRQFQAGLRGDVGL